MGHSAGGLSASGFWPGKSTDPLTRAGPVAFQSEEAMEQQQQQATETPLHADELRLLEVMGSMSSSMQQVGHLLLCLVLKARGF